MAKLPSIQFYPGDWLRDPVSSCPLAAQGLWLRLIMVMHDSNPYGHLATNGVPIPHELLAQRVGTSLEQFAIHLAELDRAGVPERTPEGVIFSRRMVRDHQQRERFRRYGRKGGNPSLIHPPNGGDNGGVNPPVKVKKKMKKGGKKVKTSEGEGAGIAFFELIPETLRSRKFFDAWRAWIAHRAERRPPYTHEAARRALPRLAAEGVDAAVERIDLSILNVWQGLFFSGDKQSKAGTNGHAKPNGTPSTFNGARREIPDAPKRPSIAADERAGG